MLNLNPIYFILFFFFVIAGANKTGCELGLGAFIIGGFVLKVSNDSCYCIVFANICYH